jgi:hypothetical protein
VGAVRRRRTYKASIADKISGLLAKVDGGNCDRCDLAILKDQRIVRRGEHYIHVHCASGADE